jgi:T4-like virus Myoviridae tail sheath stabiliser
MQQFFYDEQIRRFLLQFTRVFSNFSVEYGRDANGAPTLLRVPVRYGDSTRQVSTVMQENSASALPSTPIMTFYIAGMDYDRPRIQEPYFVSNTQVRQRTYDSETQTYETTQGNAFTIERLMPVPYKMTINLDIWTSNTNQKMQLFEQIATLFNPALEIQSTDNYLDWTSLSVVELESTTWTNRTIPQGTENPIDIMTMRFTLPIWISSPAKVKKLGVVEKIVTSIYDANGDALNAITNSDLLLGTRQLFTPYGYQTLLIGNKLQALKQSTVINPTNASTQPQTAPPSNEFWHAILQMYGTLRPGISQVRLSNEWDSNEIVGYISYDPTDDRFLLFDVDTDTVPQNTLAPIDAVINPLTSGPGAGLPSAIVGQRYLILEDMGNAEAWANCVAVANDIIEYTNLGWQVAFEAGIHYNNTQFVTNLTTGLQYRWTGDSWVKSYEGLYPGGEWSIVL